MPGRKDKRSKSAAVPAVGNGSEGEGDGPIAPRESGGENSRTPTPPEPAIYVRTTPLLKGVVAAAATRVNESERWVVERLIESFMLLPEEGRRDVLQGRLSLDRASGLVALVSWSNHAFTLGHWTWAIEGYSRLELECKKQSYGAWNAPEGASAEQVRQAEEVRKVFAEQSSLRIFAMYRQGYAYSELGLELRRRALKLATRREAEVPLEKVDEYFSEAKDAARRAIALHEEINQFGHNIALIRYNAAACCSVMAMTIVESGLEFGPGRTSAVEKLCRAVTGEGPPTGVEAEAAVTEQGPQGGVEQAWQEIGKAWRYPEKYAEKDPVKRDVGVRLLGNGVRLGTREVDRYARDAVSHLKAMEALKHGAGADGSAFGTPWPDYEYFPHRYPDDSDFLFLRYDSEFAGKYRGGFPEQAGGDLDDGLLKNYRAMADRLDRIR